ncbi:MAG: RNA pseudouridine synthase [Treponema sp.]|nr:RNA pseudouridine synthase [Treponema sp.]
MKEINVLPLKDRILYKDDVCLVINKLKGESVEGAKDGITDLALNLMSFLNTDTAEAVNRLDVPVTGCALFALCRDSLVFFNNSFSGRNEFTPVKRYWAIAEKPSSPPPERGELVHYIETKKKVNKSFAYNEDSEGRKKASLKYRITGEGKNYLFMEIELLSGRHHQIRAQLAAAGIHIKGDLKYGAKRSEKEGGIRLHARYLCFTDFKDKNKRINVTADPPQMDNLWNAFTYSIR